MFLSTKSLLSKALTPFFAHFGAGFFVLFSITAGSVIAQSPQLKMSDFVLFSGSGGPNTTSPTGPGYAVQLGSSANINGGSIGSYKLVQTTGNANITGNIYSQGRIILANGNSISGNIAASNSPSITGTILSIGSNATVGTTTSNTINVNGNILVGGGTVYARVTHRLFRYSRRCLQ